MSVFQKNTVRKIYFFSHAFQASASRFANGNSTTTAIIKAIEYVNINEERNMVT
jgi:hypothetical protein